MSARPAYICPPRRWPSFPTTVWQRPEPPAPRRWTPAARPCHGRYTARLLPACTRCHVPRRRRSDQGSGTAETAPTAHRSPPEPVPARPFSRCDAALSWWHPNAIPQASRQTAPARGARTVRSARFPAAAPKPACRISAQRRRPPDRLRSCPIRSRPAARWCHMCPRPPPPPVAPRPRPDPPSALCWASSGPCA
jgi:hypothetical protein